MEANKKFVVPMQHSIENPIQAGSQDTFIEYWINSDERVTQDYVNYNSEEVGKIAHVTIRFIGVQAENWAKAFHHLAQRSSVAHVLQKLCNGTSLEAIGDIRPTCIDYFSTGNSTIAFDVDFKIGYAESLDLSWEPLENVTIAPGELVLGGV
jgi:hypothetical protein